MCTDEMMQPFGDLSTQSGRWEKKIMQPIVCLTHLGASSLQLQRGGLHLPSDKDRAKIVGPCFR